MKDLRSVYSRYLPIVLLGAFLAVVLKIYAQLTSTKPLFYWALVDFLKYGTLWVAIGLASRQIKAAACALVVALLIVACESYLFRGQHIVTSTTISCLIDILGNKIFAPGFIFLLICFKKQALPYLAPLCLLAFGCIYLNAGSEYLALSPYNGWFHARGIDELLKVKKTAHSHVEIDAFYYVFYLIESCVIFLLIGECYISAATGKKLKDALTIDVTTRYTKTGAIAQFFTLRAAISLLVVALIIHPINWAPWLRGVPLLSIWTFNFLLTILCALALLAATTLYYRKFIVEYFIGHGKKITWLYWLVNIPVIGMLVFPFVALATGSAKPAAYDAEKVKPYKIVLAMLAVSLLFLLRLPVWYITGWGISDYNPDDVDWVFWIFQAGFLFWYAYANNGYSVILTASIITVIIFFCRLSAMALNPSGNFEFNGRLCMLTAFCLIQCFLLLPVFHFKQINIAKPD